MRQVVPPSGLHSSGIPVPDSSLPHAAAVAMARASAAQMRKRPMRRPSLGRILHYPDGSVARSAISSRSADLAKLPVVPVSCRLRVPQGVHPDPELRVGQREVAPERLHVLLEPAR